MGKINKCRYWTGVLYPENMVEDWELQIGDILQLPYAYCLHDKDTDVKSEHRKDHIHLIIAFANTTTYSHAKDVFDLLSAEGKQALNKIEAIVNIRNVYDYLIHDTETCRKQEKHQYSASERITGNNFDIGSYEQLSIADKNEIFMELANVIREKNFTNFADFFEFVADTYDDMAYIEVFRNYASIYEKLTKGNYQRTHDRLDEEILRIAYDFRPSQGVDPRGHTQISEIDCPYCYSSLVKKKGKTQVGTQRYLCKSCGKSFVVE